MLIALDTAADMFGGNENDRSQVRQFIGLLRGLAITANAGVLLASHPSLSGITTDSGLSGSTGWHNSVRSRLYFKAAKAAEGDKANPDLRELEVRKNNYGPSGEVDPHALAATACSCRSARRQRSRRWPPSRRPRQLFLQSARSR